MDDIDESFSKYLETNEADGIFDQYFDAIRRAYIAGYKAARGRNAGRPLLRCVKPRRGVK